MGLLIDLTHSITETMPVYPGTEPPILEQANTIAMDGFAEKKLTMYSHTGTHMDAPAHMIAGGKTLDSYPITQFTGQTFMLDVRNVQGRKINLDFLLEYTLEIELADFLILHTGWSSHWGSDTYFSDFPTMTAEAAGWLAQRGLKGVGLDAISIDPVGNDYSNHLQILGADMLIVENLTNLHQLPAKFTFFCMPLRIEKSDGSPIRAFGMIP